MPWYELGILVAGMFLWPWVVRPLIGFSLIVALIGLRRWRQGFGIHVEDYESLGRSIFVPGNREASRVLSRHARAIGGRPLLLVRLWGAWSVPSGLRDELYEACSHDRYDPQAMSVDVAIMGRKLNIVEAP